MCLILELKVNTSSQTIGIIIYTLSPDCHAHDQYKDDSDMRDRTRQRRKCEADSLSVRKCHTSFIAEESDKSRHSEPTTPAFSRITEKMSDQDRKVSDQL